MVIIEPLWAVILVERVAVFMQAYVVFILKCGFCLSKRFKAVENMDFSDGSRPDVLCDSQHGEAGASHGFSFSFQTNSLGGRGIMRPSFGRQRCRQ